MFNNSKILIVLILATLTLSFYILFSLNKINIQDQNNQNVKVAAIDLSLETGVLENYYENLGVILREVDVIVNDSKNTSVNKINNFKKEIFNLKSPDDNYKNIHLNLILSLDGLKDYINGGDLTDYEKSIASLKLAHSGYLKINKQKNEY